MAKAMIIGSGLTENSSLKMLDIDDLIPSPTNPRTIFTEHDMEELAESIKAHGIIQSLVVRRSKDTNNKYEIICGHRRHRGAKKAGLQLVPCTLRDDLNDEQVLDMQIHENLKREDLNPIDEGATYQLMRDNGVTIAEIVARAGRGEAYITKRLQLTNLIDAVKEDIKDGYLPLSIGVEISKYPVDAQEAVYEKLYDVKYVHPVTGEDYEEEDEYDPTEDDDNYDEEGEYIGPDPDEDEDEDAEEAEQVEPVVVRDKSAIKMNPNGIAQFIRNQFMLNLASAPFKLDATNLREDKLACSACPERTGANAALFEMADNAPDYCLNRNCFIGKRLQYIQIVRKRTAKKEGVEPNDIPLIYGNWNDERLLPEKTLTTLFPNFRTERCETIDPEAEDDDRDKPCEFTVVAMNTMGEVAPACFESTGCKDHHWSNHYKTSEGSSQAQLPKKTAEEIANEENKRKQDRKEEIFDCKVAEVVRLEVISSVAKKFATIGLGALSDFTDSASARLWQNVTYNTKGQFDKFCEASELKLPSVSDPWNDTLGFEKAVAELPQEDKAKLLIVATHYWKGDVRMNQFKSQKGVRDLAEYFDINYALIDAQQRVEFASKKNKKFFEAYLQQIEVNDPEAKVPRMWSETYLNVDEKGEKVAPAVDDVDDVDDPDDEIEDESEDLDDVDDPDDEIEDESAEPTADDDMAEIVRLLELEQGVS